MGKSLVEKSIIDALGANWAKPELVENIKSAKMYDREPMLRRKIDFIGKHLNEFVWHKGKSILDLSCGNGTFLEVMRFLGHDIMGTDVQYFECLESQEIPYIAHNGNDLPYPFKNKSYDLVTNIGSITFLEIDWNKVLDEMFRISKNTVFVLANSGPILNANRDILSNYNHKGWVNVFDNGLAYKWKYCESA